LRKGRLTWPKGNYFISSFIAEDAEHIDNIQCYDILTGELAGLEQDRDLALLALVVMPDHIHMVIKLGPDADLSRAMKLFKGRTSLKINRALKRTGSVWYQGFHDHLIRPEEPLKNFIQYIIYNPVKKGLAKNPSEWPYFLIKTDMCEGL